MVIVLVVSSILGGVLTLAALWPYSVALAVLGAPFGGSLTAILVAAHMAPFHPQDAYASPLLSGAGPPVPGCMAPCAMG